MIGPLLVDHGSRNAEANAQLEAMAAIVRKIVLRTPVAIAHLEIAEPTIAASVASLVQAGATRIQVLTYFLADGRHSREDIPRQMAAAAAGHPGLSWSVAPPLGPHHALARVLLERAGIMPSPGPAPEDLAAAVREWARGRDVASVVRELSFAGDDHPVRVAARELAAAADSVDEDRRSAAIAALFAGLVEPLNDGFTAAGRAIYADLFARIAWLVCVPHAALLDGLARLGVRTFDDLVARYERARSAGGAPDAARRIGVLSRVTIGADIALTSLALVRLRQRHPDAELLLFGDAKLAGLFGGLPGVRVVPVAYTRRGPLGERFRSWLALIDALAVEGCDLVVAPDSRLDQLGVLPVIADEGRYLLWEGVQPDGEPPRPLGELLDGWLRGRLGLPAGPAALPVVALDAPARARRPPARGARSAAARRGEARPRRQPGEGAAARRRGRTAAPPARARLARAPRPRLRRRGAGQQRRAAGGGRLDGRGHRRLRQGPRGGRARARARRAGGRRRRPLPWLDRRLGRRVRRVRLAVSYDSVGHHLAAALGVPVVTAFAGYADDAFPIAWRPRGPGRVDAVAFAGDAKERPAEWERWFAAIPAAPR